MAYDVASSVVIRCSVNTSRASGARGAAGLLGADQKQR